MEASKRRASWCARDGSSFRQSNSALTVPLQDAGSDTMLQITQLRFPFKESDATAAGRGAVAL
jgi:hypothetical protein